MRLLPTDPSSLQLRLWLAHSRAFWQTSRLSLSARQPGQLKQVVEGPWHVAGVEEVRRVGTFLPATACWYALTLT
jgi:hypothetical protein